MFLSFILDFASNFEVKINFSTSRVDLELKTSLPADVMESKQFLNLSLDAFLQEPEILNDTMRMFIALPIKGKELVLISPTRISRE